jgi:hypothetical protein
MKQGIVLGVGLIGVFLTACGSVAIGPRASVTPSETAHPTASPAATPSGVGMYPSVDTLVSAAPLTIGEAWTALDIRKTIPGSDSFIKVPPMPTVINKTNGTVSDADAQAMVVALWREDTLIQWAEANDENDFILNTLVGPEEDNFLVPDAEAALSEGGSVVDPDCDMFPTSVTLWPHTSAVDTWMTDANEQSAAPDVLIVPFSEANCRLTITVHGKTTTEAADTLAPHGNDRVLFVGEVVDDATIGPYFKIEASTSCLRPKAVSAMCAG